MFAKRFVEKANMEKKEKSIVNDIEKDGRLLRGKITQRAFYTLESN